MAPDIRNFFGGGASKADKTLPTENKADPPTKQKKRGRKVIEDSDDDEPAARKSIKSQAQKGPGKGDKTKSIPAKTPDSESGPQNSKTESPRKTPRRAKQQGKNPVNGVNGTPTNAKKPEVSGSATSRRSKRSVPAKTYGNSDQSEETPMLDDEQEGDDDIHAADFSGKGRRGRDDYEESDASAQSPNPAVTKTKNGGQGRGRPRRLSKTANGSGIESIETPSAKPTAQSLPDSKNPGRANKKRRSKAADDEEDLAEDDVRPKKRTRNTPTKPATKKPSKTEDKVESQEMKAIFDSIPTVRPPSPPARDANKKFQYNPNQNHGAAQSTESKAMPSGAENCLAGLAFVFTGVLQTLDREDGQSLVKQYGGKVTTGPSSKTSYIVLGNEAGPKKLETIAKLKLKTIDEDGLFELIRRLPANGGDSKAAEKHAEKKQQEEKAIREAAAEMERVDKEAAKARAKADVSSSKGAPRAKSDGAPQKPQASAVDSRLWTVKYAPTSTSMVCGNKSQVEKLQGWLRKWHGNAKYGFKKAGPDGSGVYRAALIHGPPGIGKTTAAHLVAKLEGFDVVETNASDTRSKKLVEDGLRGVLETTSLLGYFAGDNKKVEASKRKLVLIMDEVDGMSAGDRGGVGALAAVAKKTSIPMIMICNERRLPKMKPFDFVTWDVPFRRPTSDMIRARLMTICYREGIKLPAQVLDALIEGSHSDIRQIINMISTAKLDRPTMEYGEGKAMSKAWEKHVILKPWDIVSKILRPQMFGPTSTATLNDKIELYFNDHEFSYLMLEENYLKTTPSASNAYSGKERSLKLLELADKAASSISDGDLVDRMIHGTQQQWSLMPTHAVFSFVRPASFVYGNLGERVGFVSWLGQNSKYGKLTRYIKDIQGHMRLRASGDRHEIRQQYMPLLWQKTVKVLQDHGKEKVPEVIDLMDSYFLTKEDYDAIIELGLGPMSEDKVKIDTQAKATFTRLYNSQSHPLPFLKASSVVAPKAALKKEKPDLEDAIDESDDEELAPGGPEGVKDGDDEEDMDLKKDKYIKAPKKKKAAPKAAAKTKSKGKRKSNKGSDEVDDEDDPVLNDSESEEEVKKSTKKTASARGGRKGKGKA